MNMTKDEVLPGPAAETPTKEPAVPDHTMPGRFHFQERHAIDLHIPLVILYIKTALTGVVYNTAFPWYLPSQHW